MHTASVFALHLGLNLGKPILSSCSNVLTLYALNSRTVIFKCSLYMMSDPSYVAFHDEEWGVPAHDDR